VSVWTWTFIVLLTLRLAGVTDTHWALVAAPLSMPLAIFCLGVYNIFQRRKANERFIKTYLGSLTTTAEKSIPSLFQTTEKKGN
jgi:hypothetical protein